MQTRTLVLTHWYFPHKVIRWQDAITLSCLGKVDVIVSYDDLIRSPSTTLRMPAVIRLRRKRWVSWEAIAILRMWSLMTRSSCRRVRSWRLRSKHCWVI